MTWSVVLDPNTIMPNRTQLNLNSGAVRVDQKGIDWGDAAITAYMADMRIGSEMVDYRVPNRHVVIPLFLGADESGTEEAVRDQVQQKAALLQREGGVLLRQRDGTSGPAMYADIVDCVLSLPDQWGETGLVEQGVSLNLETLPDFYGDQIALDTATATGAFHSVLQLGGSQAAISGDNPGRCRIAVTDTSGSAQKGMLWGLRSRYYDPSPSAALFYEAEALTALNGAASVSNAAASGGNWVTYTPPGNALKSWVGLLSTNILSGNVPVTHQGSYRVWARIQANGISGNPTPVGSVQVRFAWGVGSISVPVINDPVLVPAITPFGSPSSFWLLDLGEIRLDAPPVGTNEWFGVVQVNMDGGPDANVYQIGIDCLYLQPLDDGGGRLSYVTVATGGAQITSSAPGATAANDSANGGTIAWANPNNALTIDDNTFAVATFTAGGQTSQYLKVTNRGFAIPTSAVIQGIELWCDYNLSGGFSWFFNPVKAGTVLASTFNPSTFRTSTYAHGSRLMMGGPNDLWFTSWTPADINNSGFGMAASLQSSAASTFSIDTLYVIVYYTLGTGFFVATDAVCYGNGTTEIRYDGAYRNASGASGVYGPVAKVLGDLPRLPPSGVEGRPVELFLKPTRGDFSTLPDSGLDGLSAQVFYRPSFIHRA